MFPDMEDITVHVIPGPEVYGCNTIGFADGSVLMATWLSFRSSDP